MMEPRRQERNWEMATARTGSTELKQLLRDGWEPFAVTNSDLTITKTVYLRRYS